MTVEMIQSEGGDIELTAGGDMTVITVELDEGDITATSDGDMFIDEIEAPDGGATLEAGGDFTVDDRVLVGQGDIPGGKIIVSAAGTVTLGSLLTLKDVSVESGLGIVGMAVPGTAHVVGYNITLTADENSIGTLPAPIYLNLLYDGVITAAAAEDIHLSERSGDLRLTTVLAEDGDVSLTAETGSIVDALDSSELSVRGKTATLSASGSIGESGDPLETDFTSLSAQAGSDYIWLINEGDLAILSGGLSLTGGGSILLATTGALTVTGDVSLGGSGGLILLQAQAGDLTLGGSVIATGAAVSILGQGSVTQAADTSVVSTGGTIDVEATTGAITQDDTSLISTGSATGGSVRMKSAGDITLGGIEAGSGNVALVSETGSILDGGDTHTDVAAAGLSMSAAGSIGNFGVEADPLEIAVDTLSAQSGNGISLLEADDIAVGDVNVTVARVVADGTTGDIIVSGSDLVTTGDGAIVLRTVDGAITVEDGTILADGIGINAGGSGNVLLEASGIDSGIELQAGVRSGTGNISVLSGGGVVITGTTAVATDGGSVDVEAVTGDITMDDGTSASTGTGDGNIRFKADGDVTVGSLDAGTGAVTVTATDGSIIDGGDTGTDLIGSLLKLVAGLGIGALDALETLVDYLTASAGSGSIDLSEGDEVILALVLAISVNRVTPAAETEEVTDERQSGLAAAGSVTLRTSDGSITVENDATTISTVAVQAGGSGNVLLQARGSGSDITLNAGVATGSGDISVLAADSITQAAGMSIFTTDGDIDVQATGGGIIQNAGALIMTASATGGDITLTAGGDIRLERIIAGPYLTTPGEVAALGEAAADGVTAVSDVTITAGGKIGETGLDDVDVDVVADILTMTAQDDIELEITANTLSAESAGGDITLSEYDGLAEKNPGLTIDRARAPPGAVTITAENDLRVTYVQSAIAVELVSRQGSIEINEPVSGEAIEAAPGNAPDSVILKAEQDVGSYGFIRADEHIEYRIGGEFKLPDGTVTAPVTTGTLIIESGRPLVLAFDLVDIEDVQFLSDSRVEYTGSITGITSLLAQATTEDTTVAENGIVSIHSTEGIGAANIQLLADNQVILQRDAVTAYPLFRTLKKTTVFSSAYRYSLYSLALLF